MVIRFAEPVLLTNDHDCTEFNSGEAALDEWLKGRAIKNALIGASKTYVICEYGKTKVLGYFSLSAGQFLRTGASGGIRRNMPSEIPGILLGRLAVDSGHQHKGIARALLFHAVDKALQVGEQIAVRIMFVHAINGKAAAFYESFGFKRMPVETNTLAIDLLDFEGMRNLRQ